MRLLKAENLGFLKMKAFGSTVSEEFLNELYINCKVDLHFLGARPL